MARNVLNTRLSYKIVMKVSQISHIKARSGEKPLTFGEFVAGVYQTWGHRKAKGIIHLALEVQMIKFRGAQRFVIS
jgi:hypothetical protein